MSFSPSRTGDAPVDPTPVTPDDDAWTLWKLEVPQGAAVLGWYRQKCPQCQAFSPTPTLLAHPAGPFHCERCGHHGDARIRPVRFREDHVSLQSPWWQESLPVPLIERLVREGISAGVIEAAGIGFGQAWFPGLDRWEAALMFPCKTTPPDSAQDVLALAIRKEGGYGETHRQPRAVPVPWGWDTIDPARVVVVDHPLDRLALLEAGFASVICIPDRLDPRSPENEQDWGFLAAIEREAGQVGAFVIALRDDERGHVIEEELARRLGKERCFRTRWQHHRMPGGTPGSAMDVLREFGPEAVRDEVETASPFPVSGVYELTDVEDRFDLLYEFGLQGGSKTGWPSLDVHYTVQTGQWTLVTGIPGHGKSSWLDALLVNLAQYQGWKFGLFSPENQPIERHYASLMEKVARAPFNEGSTPRLTAKVKDDKKAWLNDHFKVILPDDEKGNWSVDGVLSLAKTLVYRFGIKGLVIDPWNELDHSRPGGISETDHISASLTKIRRFARENDVHIWVVAHPAKLNRGQDGKYPVPTMYDISGCHSEDTEVLTRRGWVNHALVTKDDRVACFDLDLQTLHWDHPTDVLSFPWDSDKDGLLHHVTTPLTDALVTPNHRMVLRDQASPQWRFAQADEMTGVVEFPVMPGFGDGRKATSHQHLDFLDFDNGHLPEALWKQERAVMRNVLGALWPDDEPSMVFSRTLARDVEQLSKRCGMEVHLQDVITEGRHLSRISRLVSRVEVDTSRDVQLRPYRGMVYCLKVPGGAYMTRRAGKPGIYGNSAHWRNKADNGITIYRNVGEDDDDVCDIHVQKIRFKEIGRVGLVSLRCDRRCGIYHDDLDQVERARALQAGKHLPSSQIQVAARGPGLAMSANKGEVQGNDEFFDRLFGDPPTTQSWNTAHEPDNDDDDR